MRAVPNPRKIINRRTLSARVAEAMKTRGSLEAHRAEVTKVMKTALEEGHAEIRRRFEAGASGTEVVRSNAYLLDQILRTIHEVAERAAGTAAGKLCIVAVGGYGRGELAPFSDVDLLFLVPPRGSARSNRVVEFMLYILWDLGLKLGHSTRTVAETLKRAKGDQTILTSILESRYICGDEELYRELKKKFRALVAERAPEYVDEKLAERNERHLRMGDSRYVLEPNVKEGKGGLRDLQTLFWIAKSFYGVESVDKLVARGVLTKREADAFDRAQNFLWTLRCHLHYITGRAEERLTFDLQPEIGRRMGYTNHAGALGVERFMKHYFLTAKEVGDLTRIFCAAIDSESDKPWRFSLKRFALRKNLPEGFDVEGGRLTVKRANVFEKNPVNLLRLFRIAQDRGLDIHPKALRLVTRSLKLIDGKLRANKEANRLFLEMLTAENRDPEETLKRLNEAGIMGRFIPDFGRVVAQMQHDMYHVYTVDEHSIRAIGNLHRIDSGALADEHPVSTEVMRKIQSRTVLYLAVLLHDIAKGRGGDHSELGAKVAMKLGPRLGLSEEETETVAWLVRNHLVMSHTAQRRDISDPKTVADFVDVVQSAERLRLLLVLTVVDMKATGPTVWNSWKAALLRELYFSAEDYMTGGVLAERRQKRIEAAKTALRAALPDWSDAEFEDFAGLAYPDYWLGLDTATQARHARLVRKAEAEDAPIVIETRVDKDRGATEVTVYTGDHPGLFSTITGAIALSGGNIVDAKIFTLTNGMALDAFWVQDTLGWGAQTGGVPFEGRDRLAALKKNILHALGGKRKLTQELAKKPSALPSRTRVFKVAPRVLIDDSASTTHTVIEVNCRDRPGLLYDLTRTLTNLSLQISSAKITTYGERVVDVFYVKDVFGLKIENKTKLEQVKSALLAVIGEPAGDETPAAPKLGSRSRRRSRARQVVRPRARAGAR